MMGGDVGATNTEGCGSQFWCTVQLSPSSPPQPRRNLAAHHTANILSGLHILIVDGNRSCLDSLRSMTEFWGVRLTEAESIEEALKAIHPTLVKDDLAAPMDRVTSFNAVLFDVSLAGLTRLKDALSTQALSDLNATPRIILMTSPGQPATQPLLMQSMPEPSLIETIAKPVLRKELFAHLAECKHFDNSSFESMNRLIRNLVSTGSEAKHKLPHQPAMPRASKPIRVLLADDNRINREVGLGILKCLGIEADAVDDGAMAFAALSSNHYDLVLMDVRMPVMDGWEATRTIRDTKSNHWNPSIPIVAMTANNSEDDRRNCLAVGMDGFLSKPLVPEALRAEIVHWLPDAFPRACDDPTQFEPNSHAAVDARIDCAINAENANKPATSSEAAVVIYDRSGVLARLMGDAALAALVAQTFLNDMPRQIAALHRSVEARDRAHAELIAHTIRGAASSAGAISLSGLAQQFEAAAATAQWSALQTAANQIEAAFHEAKHQMECPDNM